MVDYVARGGDLRWKARTICQPHLLDFLLCFQHFITSQLHNCTGIMLTLNYISNSNAIGSSDLSVPRAHSIA